MTENWFVASIMAPAAQRGPDYSTWKVYYQGWKPCMEWCVATFGGGIGATARGPGWRYVGEGVFEFERDQDRTLFLLRWG